MAEKNLEEELEKELLGGDDDEFDFEAAGVQASATDDEIAESLSLQLEGELKGKEYKYLELSIEQESDTEYYVYIKHQSHGWLNYMVSKVLKCKGVDFAAYKKTTLEDPNIYVRTDGKTDIKKILEETIKYMRTEWKGMGNAIKAMDI